MVNDPIGDMIIQIKNAAMAKRRDVMLPYSGVKMALAQTLLKEGYITNVEKSGEAPKLQLRMTLAYNDDIPVLTNVKRKSKPGMRVYIGKHNIPMVVGGMGIAILSTPKGIMTGKEAKKLGLGGELLCEVW